MMGPEVPSENFVIFRIGGIEFRFNIYYVIGPWGIYFIYCIFVRG